MRCIYRMDRMFRIKELGALDLILPILPIL